MKVVIFYAKYGGGHLSAAKSIKECIETNYENVDIELIDFMEYANKIFNKVTTKAYSEMAKKVPRTWGKIYWRAQKGTFAHISTDSNKLLSFKINKLLKDINPNLIISTHPFASQICGFLKKHQKLNCPVATILTDFAEHNQWLVYNEYLEYYFVAHEKLKTNLIKKGIKESKIYATGIPISNRFTLKYDKKEILNELNLSQDKKTILFFGGGEYGIGKTYTFKIFKTLVQSKHNIQIIAISGKNIQMKEAFENVVKEENKQESVKILSYTNKVPELMSISDIVVTKPGGLTTSESLASGLAIIAINPIPGQEEENALYLKECNAAIWLKKGDNDFLVLNDLLSNQAKINEMKKISKSISKPNAAYDICKILFD